MKFFNILKQAFNISRGLIMITKVKKRIFDDNGTLDRQELMNWLETNKTTFEKTALNLNKDLWEQSLQISTLIKNAAVEKLKEVEFNLGGGGMYPLLAFLVLHYKPKTIVETGVSAGYSSFAVLEAISRNKFGKLYSSDFPLFRLPNPEKYIGVIIPDNLKKNWNLLIEGDKHNLPKIISRIDNIDIFHYDSDKSYSGREFAMNIVRDSMNENGFIVMDDIQDNSFFYDHVTKYQITDFHIYKFENKFVGLIGNFDTHK